MIYHTTFAPGAPVTDHWGTFDDLDYAVKAAVTVVTPRMAEFGVIAVQGTSGQSLGYPLYLALKEAGWGGMIVVVRKPGEEAHTSGDLVGAGRLGNTRRLRGARVLFVDDFVSMGLTRKRVRMAVEAAGATVVAQYMARDASYEQL